MMAEKRFCLESYLYAPSALSSSSATGGTCESRCLESGVSTDPEPRRGRLHLGCYVLVATILPTPDHRGSFAEAVSSRGPAPSKVSLATQVSLGNPGKPLQSSTPRLKLSLPGHSLSAAKAAEAPGHSKDSGAIEAMESLGTIFTATATVCKVSWRTPRAFPAPPEASAWGASRRSATPRSVSARLSGERPRQVEREPSPESSMDDEGPPVSASSVQRRSAGAEPTPERRPPTPAPEPSTSKGPGGRQESTSPRRGNRRSKHRTPPWLRDIRRLQRTTRPLIPRLSFARVVREILQGLAPSHSDRYYMQRLALPVLQQPSLHVGRLFKVTLAIVEVSRWDGLPRGKTLSGRDAARKFWKYLGSLEGKDQDETIIYESTGNPPEDLGNHLTKYLTETFAPEKVSTPQEGRLAPDLSDSNQEGDIGRVMVGGFRRGRRSEGQLLTLTQCIEIAQKQETRLLCCFLDVANAYDSVAHAQLVRRLEELHLLFGG
ncbi:histone H3-like centromeric protein A [Ixodes scapularis]